MLALCREVGIPVEDLLGEPVKRQRERAAERLLLREAFGHPVVLTRTEQGAPSVVGSDVNVSFSHTRRLVVLAVDEHRVIGVDAEQMDRLQVMRVRDKFLNESEKCFIDRDNLTGHVIAWTAKEAIIKAERNSALDWTNGIRLEPFDCSGEMPTDGITFSGHCGGTEYRLTSFVLEGHCITLAVPLSE